MYRFIKIDILKFTLLLLVSLIVVPCSAKREIKHFLSIPIESTNQYDKQNSDKSCASFFVSSSLQVEKSSTVTVTPYNIGLSNGVLDLYFDTTYNTLKSRVARLFPSVPIYIIHQRYRL